MAEAVVRAFAPGVVAWRGGEPGGLGSESGAARDRGAFAARGMDRFDLALMLWCSGIEDASVRSDAWAALMLDGADVIVRDRGSRVQWPRGRLQALVALALEELSPRGARARLSDAERRRRIAAREPGGRAIGAGKAWAATWGPRYRAVLAAGWGREAEAREWCGGAVRRSVLPR